MATPKPRRLTMADLAILILGSAASLGLLRMSWDTLGSMHDQGLKFIRNYRAALTIAPISLGAATALLAARPIRPRPRWRVVFRQPGTSACLVILLHMLIVVLLISWHGFLQPLLGLFKYGVHFNTYLHENRQGGAWVAVAWTTLALARAWRPEPSWIDRAGRLLGGLAILEWIWTAVIW